jgi:hypothetical protein
MADNHRLSEVFGISRELPLNYVPRDSVDGVFVENLTRDKHIVVYGSSKQGKTCLRKYNLTETDHIVVTCSNRWTTLGPLHSAILKAAGYTIEQSETKTAEGTFKVTAKVEAKGKIPFIAEGTAAGEGEYDRTRSKQKTTVPLELDPGDVNDVIGALEEIGFSDYIVLEDFHYLPDETQRDFAVALKAFHEASDLCFIVVGVWLDQNRLIQHNGDLTGRVIAVNADAWSREQLLDVIARGERLLNVEFDDTFRTGLVEGCFESVSVVQEACFRVCDNERVAATQQETRVVGASVDPAAIIRSVVDTQSARYNTFIQNFAEGFQETELQMYRWLLLPVLTVDPDELERGLPYPDIRRMISANHPRKTITANHPDGEINPGNVTQALHSTASLQVGKMRIKPIILDYDQSRRRLNVVDRGFLIWMGHQDREELLALAGLPIDPIEQLRMAN